MSDGPKDKLQPEQLKALYKATMARSAEIKAAASRSDGPKHEDPKTGTLVIRVRRGEQVQCGANRVRVRYHQSGRYVLEFEGDEPVRVVDLSTGQTQGG